MGGQDRRVVPHLRDAGGAVAPRFVFVAVVLLAINFRSVVASLPPLLPDIRRDLDLSAAAAGLLTTLPVLCFGALAPLAPVLARRRSVEVLLVACAVLTAAGAALRGLSGVVALFAGCLLAGAAVAVAQVAVPGFIRSRHPQATGRLMGAYSMALPLGATIGALAAVPLAQAADDSWRSSLAFWALPALLAAGVCTRLGRSGPQPASPAGTRTPLWRRAWAVVVFFGLQSMAFYAGLAWFPEVLQSSGWSATSAGALQALTNLVSVVPAFAVPLVAARGVSPRRLLVAVAVLAGAGVAGLLALPGAAPLWMTAIGLGQGGLLGLGLMLPTLAGANADDVTRLTAATFFGGYLIASLGPSLLGLAHDATGAWELPLLGLLAVTLGTLLPGVRATRQTR